MKLTDTQLILLTTASQRANGSLMPLPDTLAGAAARATKTITVLVKRLLAEEQLVDEPMFSWREENGKWIGVRITTAGREAIGADKAPNASTQAVEAPSPAKQTKANVVLGMLRRDDGATLDELTTATGWLPHTTRAALTGLRKKGHSIDKTKRDDATCYRIAAAA